MNIKHKKNLFQNKTAFRLFILLLFIISEKELIAQKFQVGLGSGFNTTFAKKGDSEYDESKVMPVNLIGFALSVPVYLKVNKSWYLRSGFGYQFKQYGTYQNKFDVQEEIDGTIHFTAGYNVFEFPMLVSYMPRMKTKIKLECMSGIVISSNDPWSNSSFISGTGSGTGLGAQSISMQGPESNWKATYSPDIYFGIHFVKYKDNLRKYQLGIAYQIGLNPTSGFNYSTQVKTDTQINNQDIIFKPRLNTFTITYTYFPKRFSF